MVRNEEGRRRHRKSPMGDYIPTNKEVKAYIWCINNQIKISPFAKSNNTWYVDISINSTSFKRSRKTWRKTEIWEQIFAGYVYYYNKYNTTNAEKPTRLEK